MNHYTIDLTIPTCCAMVCLTALLTTCHHEPVEQTAKEVEVHHIYLIEHQGTYSEDIKSKCLAKPDCTGVSQKDQLLDMLVEVNK